MSYFQLRCECDFEDSRLNDQIKVVRDYLIHLEQQARDSLLIDVVRINLQAQTINQYANRYNPTEMAKKV